MEKVDVNGPGTHPVYKFLKESSEAADIKWNPACTLCNPAFAFCSRPCNALQLQLRNFGSYFLVSHVGAVTRLAGGKNSPMSFKDAVQHAL